MLQSWVPLIISPANHGILVRSLIVSRTFRITDRGNKISSGGRVSRHSDFFSVSSTGGMDGNIVSQQAIYRPKGQESDILHDYPGRASFCHQMTPEKSIARNLFTRKLYGVRLGHFTHTSTESSPL
ncbi:uncharacterized protein CANTADRAFT_26390 [Suhomyces tanzawaensis NRRL Y-17324]|uniref:Uncharacterized protein n=1 Tax=Suhomyces tanzawaensis NRRL Y-17324 TaxID=984487 RepID=A0A1E4SIZ7_9ASCO|nr:uncharacterized protein CANTADRAFT_26390 [Suhomyces tanzawaensis NRRL Y-17324]ODV79486.1 hypothetical protein CANTADRAFT_26390 [Suhomyces tanzawaensis NRRL Y-17324]